MGCINCGKPSKEFDPKKRINIHGLGEPGSGLLIGEKNFAVCNLDFCSKECLYEYFSAVDAVTSKCTTCPGIDGFFTVTKEDMKCNDPRCPYIKELDARIKQEETYRKVIKHDGGLIKHILKTCKKFYFGGT